MKKQLTAVFMIFALLLTMSSCAAVSAARKLDAAEDMVEAKLDAVEDQLEYSLRKATAPDRPAVPENHAPTEARLSPEEEADGKLTQEQARQIALDHLSLTADQVTGLRADYEIDDGIPQFDVEVLQGDWEHEFEIHGETGRILSYDKDHKYD